LGRYAHRDVTLHICLDAPLDPRRRRDAECALAKPVSAVDDGTFEKTPRRREASAPVKTDGRLTLWRRRCARAFPRPPFVMAGGSTIS
jgi:hypothetical protein